MRSGGQARRIEEGSDLLTVLRAAGYLTDTSVQLLGRFVARWGVPPLDAMLESHVMSEDRLADAIAEAFKCERIYALDHEEINQELLQRVPFRIAFELELLVLGIGDDNDSMRIMMVDPSSASRWQGLRAYVTGPIKVCVCERKLVRRAAQDLYPIEAQLPGLV